MHQSEYASPGNAMGHDPMPQTSTADQQLALEHGSATEQFITALRMQFEETGQAISFHEEALGSLRLRYEMQARALSVVDEAKSVPSPGPNRPHFAD